MTKKHFEEMARFIREKEMTNENFSVLEGMKDLAIHMGKTFNYRFDADRFRRACQAEPQEL